MQGWCDSQLTKEGVLTAQMTGQYLANIKFDHVFSSDTRRAVDTGHIILSRNKKSQGLEIRKLMNFREQSYGYFEGADSLQAWFEIGAGYGCTRLGQFIQKYSFEKAQDAIKERDPFHDAENSVEFWDRLSRGINILKKVAQNGQNILVISHGMTIRSLVHRYDSEIDVTKSPYNGSVTKIQYGSEYVEIQYYNKQTEKFN